MDWGLAKVLTGEPEVTPQADGKKDPTRIVPLRDATLNSRDGNVLGTWAFMSPEQAGGEVDKVDERSDVFGLGAVLCAILTGQPPYVGPNVGAVGLLAIRGDIASAFARLEASGVDAELAELCRQCLAPDREMRLRDAGEVARVVTAHLAAAEERARQADLDRVRVEGEKAKAAAQEHERARRRRAIQWAGGLLAAALAVGVAVSSVGRRSGPGCESRRRSPKGTGDIHAAGTYQ